MRNIKFLFVFLMGLVGCGQLPTMLDGDTSTTSDTVNSSDTVRSDDSPVIVETGVEVTVDTPDVVSEDTLPPETAVDVPVDTSIVDVADVTDTVDTATTDTVDVVDVVVPDVTPDVVDVRDTVDVVDATDTMEASVDSGTDTVTDSMVDTSDARSDACVSSDVPRGEPACFFDYDDRWFRGCLATNCMCHSPTNRFCFGIIRSGCPSLTGPGAMPCDPRTERWIDYRCYPSSGACTTAHTTELRGFPSPVTCMRNSFVPCLDYGDDGCYFTSRPAWENPNISLPNCPRSS